MTSSSKGPEDLYVTARATIQPTPVSALAVVSEIQAIAMVPSVTLTVLKIR
jgi:hypothetical protein